MKNNGNISNAAGKAVSMQASVGDIAGALPPIGDPLAVVAARAANERASMLGALTGAYLTMTGLLPTEAELVQSTKESGDLSFRFRPIAEPTMLYVLLHRSTGGDVINCKVLPPGTSREAAAMQAQQANDTLSLVHPTQTVAVFEAGYEGFTEDLK